MKVVFESRMTQPTYVPVVVFLSLSVLDLGLMYATDRRQTETDRRQTRIIVIASALLWRGIKSGSVSVGLGLTDLPQH